MSPIQPSANAPWVSMRHLQRVMAYFKARGLDGKVLFEKAGLQPAQLADGEAKVPVQALETLMAVFQFRHPDRFIGLRVAEDIQPSTLGTLGFLMQSCATLSDLMNVAVRFNGMMSNIGVTSVHHAPGEYEVRWACSDVSPALRRQLHEYIIGSIVVMGRLMLHKGPDTHTRINFSHPAPLDPEHFRVYQSFFGCPVHFDQPHSSIVMPARMAQAPLPHGDAALRALLEPHTQRVFERKAAVMSLREDVDRLLQELVPGGNPTREELAKRLGMSARSLHRRLEEEGTSYREQLDVVRLQLAQSRLANGDIAVVDLSDLLGFSSPQAFIRWFRQRCEITPGQYRQQHARHGATQPNEAAQPGPSSAA